MKQALLAVAALSAILATTAAPAQGEAPPLNLEVPAQPAPPAPQGGTVDPAAERASRLGALDQAIRAEQARSKGAVGGIIAGAVIIGAGFIASVIKTVDNDEKARQEAEENGESEYTYETDATAATVGVAIGVPVIVMSIVSKARANRRAQTLRDQRARLMMSTGPGGAPTLALNIAF